MWLVGIVAAKEAILDSGWTPNSDEERERAVCNEFMSLCCYNKAHTV